MTLERPMFDTVAAIFQPAVNSPSERGPYAPKELKRSPWERHERDYLDAKSGERRVSVNYYLNRPEARIALLGNCQRLRIESSLPKVVYGNNVSTVVQPDAALALLGEFVRTFTEGPIPDLREMEYLRADYCWNFNVGSRLRDYVASLSRIAFLGHIRTTDRYDGVEWWNKSRMVRAYDKFHEILEKDGRHSAF